MADIMFPRAFWLSAILFIGLSAAVDVPFVFDSSSSGVAGFSADQLESLRASSPDLAGVPTVTQVADKDVLDFPITGGGNAPEGTTETNVGELKKTFDTRVEPNNPLVRKEALSLASKYPGDHTIDQTCSIYSYLKNGNDSRKGWSYVPDPRGVDYFMYANETLKIGKDGGSAGTGDCDDFAILMSALVESIGGSTRIIFSQNKTMGGHAYAEVYLGQLNTQNSQVEAVLDWLKQKYDTDKIYTHIDTDTKDVWLNLDWSADHPGGPFYQGDKHIVLFIRDRYAKFPLRVPQKPWIINPQDASAWFEKGNVYYKAKSYEEAIYCYDKAITLNPNYSDALGNKGITLGEQKQFNEALECFDKVIEINPSNSMAWYYKGKVLAALGNYDEALPAYDEAIKLNPKYAIAWFKKGLALKELGRKKEADAAIAKAEELGYKG